MNQASATNPMRRALAQRLHELVDRLAETTDDETVERVLGMADATSALSVVLEHALLGAASLRDPLAAARARGIDSRQRLIEQGGGVLRLAAAAERLGVTSQAVTARRLRRTILAVPMPNGEWVYPVCQFGEHGIIRDLESVLKEFQGVSPWTQLAVLLAPSKRFGGKSALELLQTGDVEAARSIAATYGEQG